MTSSITPITSASRKSADTSTTGDAKRREHGMTVVGFVRQDHYNIYTGSRRIHHAAEIPADCLAR